MQKSVQKPKKNKLAGTVLFQLIISIAILPIICSTNFHKVESWLSRLEAKLYLAQLKTVLEYGRVVAITHAKTVTFSLPYDDNLTLTIKTPSNHTEVLYSLAPPKLGSITFNNGNKIQFRSHGMSATAGTISYCKKQQQISALIIARTGRCRIKHLKS